MFTCDYAALKDALAGFLPSPRLIDDPLRLLAYGTDASFYRLIPKLVVKAESETEVMAVLAACRAAGAPITFRAAGTSLSGQSISDSVLLILGDSWTGIKIEDNGKRVRLQPGVVGAEANRKLAAFARKIGPDPASIDSAKIGGIAANNSSGMCCGTAENSYQTLLSMRLILADGTLVDTGDENSAAAFRGSHAGLLAEVKALSDKLRANEPLAQRVRRKFAIKNTTGYGLNALLDFDDPLQMLQHLMIGSEGTLGFIAEVTYRTVDEHPHKASALVFHPDIEEACRAVQALSKAPVSAVELMDRASIRSVEGKPGMPDGLSELGPDVVALLIECRAPDAVGLLAAIKETSDVLEDFALVRPFSFTADPAEFGKLWKIRKGLLPAVGAVRQIGTAVITEDVAVSIDHLAQASLDMRGIFAKHGYDDAILFGHALAGNLHFVFTQDFGHDSEVLRYAAFMDELCEMLVAKYDGSLKAEHGTGRNMAPFVPLEWGAEATGLMRSIKALLDPQGLLNPGVILNDDPKAHLADLKPMPPADPLVDSCIECGFCERMCPSHGMTLSPRQRIAGWREISRAKDAGEGARAKALSGLYNYMGLDTCATCGLCATACPVGIETGTLIKSLRGRQGSALSRTVGKFAAEHFGLMVGAARVGLAVGGLVKPSLPRAASPELSPLSGVGEAVIYIPSCASRSMGPSRNDDLTENLPDVVTRLLVKAGFQVVIPSSVDSLCCGQPFDSKGQFDTADAKSSELFRAVAAADAGRGLPVIMDTAACTNRLKTVKESGLELFDLVEFLHDKVLPRLSVTPQPGRVMLHIPCSIRKQGLEDKLLGLAKALAGEVVIPDGVMCCGFGGDRGFVVPELNDYGLRKLELGEGCCEGFSANRTCEIGLSSHSGVPYRSIAYLLDRVSR
ncbi:MAG TPA: FAD-binding and (Fe-S)-binding domain-containing protein [Candidatus Sulfotelmatobacter sp.]|jgi:D-lactate dehydrogenase|nr:FAD-binding and (Fe-S)-binding domain-containing protein [Candidatus Sulfotelmatobacter sp.]